MRALSIRQPYAELILRGVKTAELRSRPTRVVGERFHLYACRARAAAVGVPVWSADLRAGSPMSAAGYPAGLGRSSSNSNFRIRPS